MLFELFYWTLPKPHESILMVEIELLQSVAHGEAFYARQATTFAFLDLLQELKFIDPILTFVSDSWLVEIWVF
jgi:hypothetical protein